MPHTINKYFKILYDQINIPIQIINEKGNIVYVNPAFTLQWDYTMSELKEYSIFHDSELKNSNILDKISKVFETKKGFATSSYNDSLLKSKEIAKPFFRTKVFYIQAESENYAVLFHEDETESILMNEELSRARDANRESDRLKNNFLSVLSHELRTPLNIILGYSSILKESIKDKVGPEDKVYLDNLHSGSERLFKSITQMLEFAQIESENYKLNIERIDLLKILQNSINTIKSSADEKGLKINTIFSSSEIFVDVDLHCVENSLNNILNNAVKFTKQGFVEIETSLLEESELAVCRIKDSGVGISSDYVDHLFQPFSQEDLNIGRNFEGSGLGLALSKKYFEKMGGSLLIDSIKGVGTTVTFTLPLSHASDSSNNYNKNHLKKILMLDDSSDSFGLVNAFLKKSFEIDAHNFREFKYDLLSKKDYRLILFDVNQNRWNESIQVCKELKEKDSYMRPIVVISSEFEGNKIREFYEAGADKFLVKPFSKSDLMRSLEELNP